LPATAPKGANAVQIAAMTEHTGAEIRDLDLSQPAGTQVQQALKAALTTHHVLAIRDQRLSPAQLVRAVGLFGEIFPQHNTRFALPDCPQIHYLSNQDHFPDGRRYIPGEGWHTDHSNDARPPMATVLHAVTLPSRGGDTQFANMAAAHDALPGAMQARLAPLMAIHIYQSSHSARKLMALSDANRERVPNAVLHPMVRTHPESGRRSLYINPIRIEGILGLDHREALPLLDELLAHATQPRFQYRHAWLPGDLVIWDNRCLLHKANGDYDMSELRYLYRVMLKGDVPR
jgi:taurine dioxygenase